MQLQRIVPGELPIGTMQLAKALIGCVLVRDCPDGRAAGRIIEVEAYTPKDPASHAYRGKTPRNAAMFGGPHRAYVYLIYGTSYCVNVTGESAGVGAAVLLRALEPLVGIGIMESRRGTTRVRDLCRGPGRLAQALAIDRSQDGADLLNGTALWLARAQEIPERIGVSTRIGLTKASQRLRRFYEPNNPFVSGPRALSS
ncbi:MAG TPA: DNA-3-methyladenine glycosylase [Candidatus Baltobacteraceae bacterium]